VMDRVVAAGRDSAGEPVPFERTAARTTPVGPKDPSIA
jgi:hypothetical protein